MLRKLYFGQVCRETKDQDRYFAEVKRFEEKYGNHPAPGVVEKVAKALVNQTQHIWQSGDKERYRRELIRLLDTYKENWEKNCPQILALLIKSFSERCQK